MDQNSFLGKVLGILFVLIGTGIGAYGVYEMVMTNSAVNWPTVEGVVSSSRVIDDSDSDGHSYSAYVKYRYKVDGVEYSSDRIRFGDVKSNDFRTVEKILEGYPVGENIVVYYNVGRPNVSVLEVSFHLGLLFKPIFGLIFVGAGVYGISQACKK